MRQINNLRSKISDPMLKYIDEQFHVENDYVFYLDFFKYNTVPSYILPKCTEFLQKDKGNITFKFNALRWLLPA